MSARTHLASIAILAVLLYANTLGHQYAFDDAIVLTKNEHVQLGIQGIPALLSEDSISGFLKTETRLSGGRYRPLSLVTFAIERSLFGAGHPGISHGINLLLYGVTGLLLYLLLLGLMPERRNLAWLATLLFLAHPLHTEVVANIKGRDELLMFALALGSALLTLRKRPIWGGCLFGLALLAKENAITLLAVLPPALVLFRGHSLRAAGIKTLPWLVAAIVFVVLRIAIVGFLGDRGSTSLLNDPFAEADAAAKFATIMLTLGHYLWLMLIPHPLICDYSYNQVPLVGWGNPLVLLSLVAHLGLAILVIRKRGSLGLILLYYFATLSIVSNLAFPIGVAMAERFLYLPSLAFCIAVAALILRTPQRARPVLAGVLLLAFSAKTIHRNAAWKDDWTLFSCDVRKAPNNARMQLAYGEHALRQNQLPEAVAALTRSVEIYPAANSYQWLARAQTAAEDWPGVLASTEAGLTRGDSLAGLHALRGKALLRSDSKAEAITHLQRARDLKDESLETRKLHAFLLLDLGRIADALPHLRELIAAAPEDLAHREVLARALHISGDPDGAIAEFAILAERQPDSLAAHYRVAAALEERARTEEAIAAYQDFLDLAPDHAVTHFRLGRLLLATESPQAIPHLERAVAGMPEPAQAQAALEQARTRFQQE
jgi:tetratricopeptide (TPR) repeat protein